MLRHYHEIELLVPDQIDQVTGYRFYRSDQLETLHKIVALKDLGLLLAETLRIVHGRLADDEVREILLNRRATALAEAVAAQTTVFQIDVHLEELKKSPRTPRKPKGTKMLKVDIKAVEARLVAQLSAEAESWAPSHIGPAIQPLYQQLTANLKAAKVDITGPSTAWYEDTPEGKVVVNATLTIAERPTAGHGDLGFRVTELPALKQVASAVHVGSMQDCGATYEHLLGWIEDHGFKPLGYGREVDIECDPSGPQATELQIAIESAEPIS